jgi:hypothetical protein
MKNGGGIFKEQNRLRRFGLLKKNPTFSRNVRNLLPSNVIIDKQKKV